MIRFSRGDLQLTILDAGTIRLDGGAMFGVVPKVLWERERPADERNRIELGMNVLLIEDGRERTLVDTGAGDKWRPKEREIYGLETKSADEVLSPAGITPDQVDRVIVSHLHFDHAGGNTTIDAGQAPRAAYPNAEYVVQAGELETARWDNERTRGSYLAENFEPLVAQGRVRLIEGDTPLGSAVSVQTAPGHTPHMQIVLVSTGEGVVAFLADLVPTASHVKYPYIMGFDLEPLETLATKKRVLPRAVREDWWVVFEHDKQMPLARLAEDGGRIAARPLRPEA